MDTVRPSFRGRDCSVALLWIAACGVSDYRPPRGGADPGAGGVRDRAPGDAASGPARDAGARTADAPDAGPDAAPAGTRDLVVHFLDVGQGDAILVHAPGGRTMLIDAGPPGRGRDVAGALADLGIRRLDHTVVSHFHADHVGGMDEVLFALGRDGVGTAWDRGGSFDNQDTREYAFAAGERRRTARVGDAIDLGPEVEARVVHADTQDANENLNSVVVYLVHGSVSFLFGGDCEVACERAIDPGPVDVYKVHHHGSDTSSTADLLDRIEPVLAYVPVGARNGYGHPHPATMDRLRGRGMDVLRADLDGTVAVRSDGKSFRVE